MGIAERLKEARNTLGMSQAALAEAIGATKRSVINWEGDAASPSAEVLARYAGLGVDVLYVLTGQRGVQPAPSPALRDGEAELLEGYRALSARERLGVKALIAGMAPGGVNVQMSGNGPAIGNVAGSVVINGHATTTSRPRTRKSV